MASDRPRLRSNARSTATGPGRRTIYVSANDVDVWEAAEKLASERRVSMSSLIADALARYVAKPPAEPE